MGVPHSGSPGESPAVCPAPPPSVWGKLKGRAASRSRTTAPPAAGLGEGSARGWVPSPMRQNWACTQRDNKAPPQARDLVTLPAALGGSEPSTAQ